jgi:hypothetical protein
MSQKSHNPKFKGKYFVSVIGIFQFVVPSGNTGLLSPQQVSGLTQFLPIRCSLVSCLSVQCVFVVEHYFRTQSCEAVKQVHQVHFPVLLYHVSQPFLDLKIDGATLRIVDRGSGTSAAG